MMRRVRMQKEMQRLGKRRAKMQRVKKGMYRVGRRQLFR
jgi:hypothetical protein